MADNTTQASWEAGDVIATDDLVNLNGSFVSGVKMQRVKVCWGQDNVAFDTTSVNALPVQIFQQGNTLAVKEQEGYAHPTYFAVLDRLVTGDLAAGTPKPILSISSPPSPKWGELISINIGGYATTTTAGTVEFILSRTSVSPSGGTVLTPASIDTEWDASSCDVRSLPTVSGLTTVMVADSDGVAATANSPIKWSYEPFRGMREHAMQLGALLINPGESFVLSVRSTAAVNLTLNATITYIEAD